MTRSILRIVPWCVAVLAAGGALAHARPAKTTSGNRAPADRDERRGAPARFEGTRELRGDPLQLPTGRPVTIAPKKTSASISPSIGPGPVKVAPVSAPPKPTTDYKWYPPSILAGGGDLRAWSGFFSAWTEDVLLSKAGKAIELRVKVPQGKFAYVACGVATESEYDAVRYRIDVGHVVTESKPVLSSGAKVNFVVKGTSAPHHSIVLEPIPRPGQSPFQWQLNGCEIEFED
mgnify:CR=1 FL=1